MTKAATVVSALAAESAAARSIYVGTSGWSYPDWQAFYGEEKKTGKAQLTFYAQRFKTVEYNRSFYNITRESTMAGWRDLVPADFQFAMKANKRITHVDRLAVDPAWLADYLAGFSALGAQLGPILFQLPPSLDRDDALLVRFLDMLPKALNQRYTIEFRNPNWHDDAVYTLLRQHGVTFCMYDIGKNRSPGGIITAPLQYVRLHGSPFPYRGSYSQDVLADWSAQLTTGNASQRFLFFDNSIGGGAPLNAQTLLSQVLRK